MKFSEAWLREWVNTKLDSTALSHQITMAGLEVTAIKSAVGLFNGIIVGEIVKCEKHPYAQKAYLVKVNIGRGRLLSIICKASNCRKGIKVAVATEDVNILDAFKVKNNEVTSDLCKGMLCSFFELGISHENRDIIAELPHDAPVGSDIREYMKIDDNIIEISVTPNRSDCLSIIGIAREISIFNQTKLKNNETRSVEVNTFDTLPIQIEAIDACPCYLGRIVKNVNVKAPTPLWMKEKLRCCGIQSINAVSDITNYILLELGQPVHVFDKDCISNGIIVRMAKEKERIILFDEKEVELSSDTLVIADHDKILAIAGISGSKYSEIRNDTNSLFLTCAFFNPLVIRGYAHRYGIHTNASYRYERGIDPMLQHTAMERFTHFLLNICGGKASLVINVTDERMLPSRPTIVLRRIKIDRLLGYRIADWQISSILRRVGCKVKEGQGKWQVIAPSWRFDMEIEEDLIEEIARIYGYHNIPEKPVQVNLKMSVHKKDNLSLKRVKNMLNDKGYQEVITYSFVNPRLQQLLHPGEKAIVLPNPISKEMSVMRLSLWSGLLSTVVYNQNRQQNRVRIFETGFRFIPDVQANLGVRQDLMLAGAISGNLYEEHWDMKKKDIDFYDIKGDLESIFDITGKLSEVEFRAQVIPALHTGKSAAIYLHEQCIGFIGIIHPILKKKINLHSCTVVFELEWNRISNYAITQVQKVSFFPMNRRDISIVVPESVPAADVLSKCRKAGGSHVVGVNLFDVYRGQEISKGCKSLAISILFQGTTHTLKEEEITTSVNRCVEELKKRFHASLRDNTYVAFKH